MSNDEELHNFAIAVYTNYQDFLDYNFALLVESNTRKLAETFDPPLSEEELKLIQYVSILWRAYDENYNGLRPYTNEQIDEFLQLHLGPAGYKFAKFTVYYMQFKVREEFKKENFDFSLSGINPILFHIIRDGYWLTATDFNIYLNAASINEDMNLVKDVIKDRINNKADFATVHFATSKEWMAKNYQLIECAHEILNENQF